MSGASRSSALKAVAMRAGSAARSNMRRAVLEIEVNSAILLQELAHFHKRKLLERLQEKYPSPIKELRFRSGTW